MHGSYFGVTPSGQNTHGEGVFKTRNGEWHYEQESMWNTGVKYSELATVGSVIFRLSEVPFRHLAYQSCTFAYVPYPNRKKNPEISGQ